MKSASLLAAALSLLMSRSLLAQDTPAFDNNGGASQDATSSKIGWFLEQEFQSYLQNSCSLQPIKDKNGVELTSIPTSIINALGGTIGSSDVWNWVLLPQSYSAANAFLTISKTQSFPDHIDPNFTLPLDPLQDPETMIIAGASATMYSTNCTGIIAASASANANASFLFASLSAAAKADYTNSTNAELGMVKGDFNSPFLQMYGGNLGDAASMFAHMALWNWYRQQNPLPAGPLYALHWFKGITLYQVDKLARQVDGSATLSANANYLGFVGASGSIAGKYQQYGSTTIRDYKFAAYAHRSTQQYTYDQIDSVGQIANWSKTQPETAVFNKLSTFSPVLGNSGSQNSATHEQIINGLPTALCNPSLWAINPGGSTTYGTLKLESTARIISASSGQPPACAFSVEFSPNAATLGSPLGTLVPVQYAFDTSIGSNTIEIKAAEVDFTTSNYPQLSPKTIGRIQATTQGTDLQWTIVEEVVSDPTVTADAVQVAQVLVQPSLSNCTAFTGGQIGVPAGGIAIDPTGTQLTVTVQQDFSSMVPIPVVSDPTKLTNCTINMKLHLLMRSSKTADLALPANTEIAYPQLTKQTFRFY
jgi:hypothetical protein